MSLEVFKFVGYWNGDTENPEIYTEIDLKKHSKLCVITLEIIPDSMNRHPSKGSATLVKVAKELKNLAKVTKLLK